MAINPPSFSTESVQEQLPFALELLASRPTVGAIFAPTRPPGQIVGWYNSLSDAVELYVVNRAGNRFLKIG